MPTATRNRSARMDKKTISISAKRQITIPQSYYEKIGFDREAECIMCDAGLVIIPARKSGGEFAEQILEDLIKQGYSGQELLAEFKKQQAKIRPAVERMIEEANALAKGNRERISLDDLFSGEE